MVLLITTQDTNSRFVQGFLFVCFLSIIVFCNCLDSSKCASHPMEIDSPIGKFENTAQCASMDYQRTTVGFPVFKQWGTWMLVKNKAQKNQTYFSKSGFIGTWVCLDGDILLCLAVFTVQRQAPGTMSDHRGHQTNNTICLFMENMLACDFMLGTEKQANDV